jgi:hypothetical protein
MHDIFQKLKYLGIHFKTLKGLFNENYKSLKKEINGDIKICKTFHDYRITESIRENGYSTKINPYAQFHLYQNSKEILYWN